MWFSSWTGSIHQAETRDLQQVYRVWIWLRTENFWIRTQKYAWGPLSLENTLIALITIVLWQHWVSMWKSVIQNSSKVNFSVWLKQEGTLHLSFLHSQQYHQRQSHGGFFGCFLPQCRLLLDELSNGNLLTCITAVSIISLNYISYGCVCLWQTEGGRVISAGLTVLVISRNT